MCMSCNVTCQELYFSSCPVNRKLHDFAGFIGKATDQLVSSVPTVSDDSLQLPSCFADKFHRNLFKVFQEISRNFTRECDARESSKCTHGCFCHTSRYKSVAAHFGQSKTVDSVFPSAKKLPFFPCKYANWTKNWKQQQAPSIKNTNTFPGKQYTHKPSLSGISLPKNTPSYQWNFQPAV